ncbi:PilZ domain-containing protein [Sulfuricurvum sp.]|uniref:PilZ domain-containing protein n=1 Tax=Sulfuricurvum sp. TaxID=2025608 RepID=UPI002624C4BD|nr:PilZ domain-containing protein [Sulfuricurvum sp.]MDD4883977.1 hypothetical protein [Sulfuricurvum sp.]
MSIQKIAKYSKYFDLLVIHDDNMALPFSEVAKQLFKKVTYRKSSELTEELLTCHLLIFCTAEEVVSPALLKTVTGSVQRLESILFATRHSDARMLRCALSLRAFSASDVPNTEEAFVTEMLKVFPSLIKKHNEGIIEGHHRYILEHSNYLFAINKGGKVIYANEPMRRYFNAAHLSELEPYINTEEITSILNTPGSNQKVITRADKSDTANSEYLCNTYPMKEGETLIGFLPLHASLQNCGKRLLNRMSFIELLKDAFVIHASEDESIPIVMIHIENAEKIIQHNGENVYNDLCKELVLLAQNHFGKEAEIAQWHKDVYTLISSNTTIEEFKTILEGFHKEAALHVTKNGAVPVLDSFVIDLEGVDLNKAISIIDHIQQKQLLSADLKNLAHHEISAAHTNKGEKGDALHHLEMLMLSKAPLKLLNFYKGIRINTPARIVKLADGMVYIAIEKIQGYAMKLEQQTVIQAANLPFDLQANVKIVDVAKKICVLSQFHPLKASANNRQYIRIQSDHRMHVTMTSAKSSMSGTILDISIKSIACQVKLLKSPPELESLMLLQFNLPLASADNGMVNMVVEGRVQYVQPGDDFTKIVVVLDLQEPFESYLIDYIYSRQQALINEIKMIANKL